MQPLRLLLFLAALSTANLLNAEDPAEPTLAPVPPKLRSAAINALAGFTPPQKTFTEGINKNGVYTLAGKFSANERTLAIVDINGTPVVCAWTGKKWEPTSFFTNINAEWLRPGLAPEESRAMTIEAKRPFWPLTLQGHPLLAIASTPDKYHQEYEVFLLDTKFSKILDRSISYRLAPEIIAGHLATADGSRRRAIWGQTFFSRIEKDRLVLKAGWGEYVPYNQREDNTDYYYATRDGESYVVISEYDEKAKSNYWLIYQRTQPDGQILEEISTPAKSEKVYAKIYVTDRRRDPFEHATLAEDTLAYIFEKLTGLPRQYYRVDDPSVKPVALESVAVIKVVGEKDAVKRLSPRSKFPWKWLSP